MEASIYLKLYQNMHLVPMFCKHVIFTNYAMFIELHNSLLQNAYAKPEK